MCGIVGALGNRDSDLIMRMTESMCHRGPDSGGYFFSAAVGLGVRRLSIVDFIRGDQPIYNEKHDKAVVCNGEIYNHLALRKELCMRGHSFRTNSDTEVIIHLYEEYGERCVSRLNGMFAFVIADGSKLFIVRDRMGIKPLYFAYIQESNLFIFASEIKALLRCPELSVTIDEEALTEGWVLGYPLGEKTYFKNIRCLEPGHYLRVLDTPQGIQITNIEYYKVSIDSDDSLDYRQSEDRLYALLEKSAQEHLQGDVKIGLALSGGVDSSTLAFLMKRNLSYGFPTFTIADSGSNPDLVYSASVAQSIQSDHVQYVPTFKYYLDSLPSFILSSEQFQLRLVPLFLLSREISKHVKVCLIGEGADELFGGYPRYLNPAMHIFHFNQRLECVRRLNLPMSKNLEFMVASFSEATILEEQLKIVFLTELQEQLTRGHLEFVDKLSMAFGVEMRVPFLGDSIVDFANKLPFNFKVKDGTGKCILKTTTMKVFGEMAANQASREKFGFHMAGKNFLDQFYRWCQINLPDKYTYQHEYAPFFYSYRARATISKGSLLLFDLFRYIFIRPRGELPSGFTIKDFIAEKINTPAD